MKKAVLCAIFLPLFFYTIFIALLTVSKGNLVGFCVFLFLVYITVYFMVKFSFPNRQKRIIISVIFYSLNYTIITAATVFIIYFLSITADNSEADIGYFLFSIISVFAICVLAGLFIAVLFIVMIIDIVASVLSDSKRARLIREIRDIQNKANAQNNK